LREKAVKGWEAFDGKTPHKPWIDQVKIACPKCKKPISRIPDVGNPWLDAGIVAYSTTQYNTDQSYWEKWVPADLILECFPGQYRHWYYSLLAMSTMMEGIPPCKTIVGHALVHDENGEEMHKSKGNAIWFDDAVEQMGAEVMRWIYCTQELSSTLNFGYSKAKFVRGRFFNTLWNSYAFFVNYARLVNFTPSAVPPDVQQRPDFDRWILSKLHLLIRKCRKSFENYDVRTACRNIEEFLESLSNWYIRNNRRRFWRSQLEDDTLYAYETLFECLYTTLRLLAPVLPMLTEACYQNMVRSTGNTCLESIHLTAYPVENDSIVDETLVEDMDVIAKIHQLALSAREKAKIKIRQPLSKLMVSPGSEAERRAVRRFSDLLKDGVNVKQIEVVAVRTSCPVDIQVKPNKRSLGQKYKAKSKLIVEKIEEQLDTFREDIKNNVREFTVDVDGEVLSIGLDDLFVEEVDPEHLTIVRSNESWIAYDVTLDEELMLEGLMRDFLRQMQVLRKDIGLEIENRIAISYTTNSPKIRTAIERYREFICQELLCVELTENSETESKKTLTFASEEIHVGVTKVA
jgi:isoleucyl-tRNA synthetase